MLVIDLINRLKQLDPQWEVYFAHPSHDYWRSELATPVESMDTEVVKHSSYHDQMTTVDPQDVDQDDAEQQVVLMLR